MFIVICYFQASHLKRFNALQVEVNMKFKRTMGTLVHPKINYCRPFLTLIPFQNCMTLKIYLKIKSLGLQPSTTWSHLVFNTNFS